MYDDKKLIELFKSFKEEVLDDRISLLEAVHKSENQGEGWLKFELIDFLSKKGISFGTEVAVDEEVEEKRQNKIDLRIGDVFIELKQILIGTQDGSKYNVSSYVTGSYIKNDINKLKDKANGYILMLAVKNPKTTKDPNKKDKTNTWEKQVKAFNEKGKVQLKMLTFPDKYPEAYFLGLLKVEKKN